MLIAEKQQEELSKKNRTRNIVIYSSLAVLCIGTYLYTELFHSNGAEEEMALFSFVCLHFSSVCDPSFRFLRGAKWFQFKVENEESPHTHIVSIAVRFLFCQSSMSLNASIKQGKGAQESNERLTSMVSGISRQKRENMLKKKRASPSFLESLNKVNGTSYSRDDVLSMWESITG